MVPLIIEVVEHMDKSREWQVEFDKIIDIRSLK